MNPIPQPERNEASALAAAKVAARKAAEGVEMPPIVEQYYEFCAWLLPKVSKFEKDQKYILGTRLQNAALDALDLIINAALSPRDRKAQHLGEALLKLGHYPPIATIGRSLRSCSTSSWLSGLKVRRSPLHVSIARCLHPPGVP